MSLRGGIMSSKDLAMIDNDYKQQQKAVVFAWLPITRGDKEIIRNCPGVFTYFINAPTASLFPQIPSSYCKGASDSVRQSILMYLSNNILACAQFRFFISQNALT